jgi:hypothetical protein
MFPNFPFMTDRPIAKAKLDCSVSASFLEKETFGQLSAWPKASQVAGSGAEAVVLEEAEGPLM